MFEWKNFLIITSRTYEFAVEKIEIFANFAILQQALDQWQEDGKMQKLVLCSLAITFLLTTVSVPIKALDAEVFPEGAQPSLQQNTPAASPETIPDISSEAPAATSSLESTPLSTPEITSVATPETASPETITIKQESPPEEGAGYKDVPWGASFEEFKKIKDYTGNLVEISAAFIGTSEDNDIALLLGTPLSEKGNRGEQRVMFEYVPQKFSSAYVPSDDVYYIFYSGKFALAFTRISEANFDIYRDHMYKKYKKTGSFSKQFMPSPTKRCTLVAIKFEKGKTFAFLIKKETYEKKSTVTAAKLVFAYNDLFRAIQQEIKANIGGESQMQSPKAKESLEKDLQKIE
jgi:hypothetical protein